MATLTAMDCRRSVGRAGTADLARGAGVSVRDILGVDGNFPDQTPSRP